MSDLGTCQIDTVGRMIDPDEATIALLRELGVDPGGTSLHDAVHTTALGPVDHGPNDCPVVEAARDGLLFRERCSLARADGGRSEIQLTEVPYRADRHGAAAMILFEDVSEQLQQWQVRDDYLAFAAHELRNPLTVIVGLTAGLSQQAAREPAFFKSRTRRAIQTLEAEAARLERVIEVFLDYRRAASQFDEVDLVTLVLDEGQAAARRRPHASFSTDVTGQPVIVRSNAACLRMVIVNLMDNAAKYGGSSPQVLLELFALPGQAMIRVTDSGPGIPVAEQTRIFEPHYRGSAALHSGQSGQGVGLFVAKELVNLLGGILDVESAPGHGATFTVALPMLVPSLARSDHHGDGLPAR